MNKKIKITDYTRKGKKTRYEYLHLTKWQAFKLKVKIFFRRLTLLIILLAIIYGIFQLGAFFSPKTIYTKQEVIKEIPVKAVILQKIAKCESPTGHWENGQVVVRSNTNRSVDIGKYQINNYAWGKKATELGLNLMVEEDNEAMANWIYTNRGTEDWYSSKKCWQK